MPGTSFFRYKTACVRVNWSRPRRTARIPRLSLDLVEPRGQVLESLLRPEEHHYSVIRG